MANLSFSDFVKIFTAYQQYVTSVQAPVQAPVQPQMATPVQPQEATPVAQPQMVQAQVAQAPDFGAQYEALNQRLTAMEHRAPMPTMETPAPVTVDDIIKGIIE